MNLHAPLSPVSHVDLADKLANQFAGRAAHFDRTGEFPRENFTALREAGLLGLLVPRRFGGPGQGLERAQAVVSAIARGEPSTALVLAMHYVHHGVMARVERWPALVQEALQRESATELALINTVQVEPRLGSPAHGGRPETIARRVGDEWRLSGHKSYATGLPGLSWMSVLAVTDEPEPRLGSFLIRGDAPGLRQVESWNATGMRATASHDVILDDVATPLDHVSGLQPASEPLRRDEHSGPWFFTLTAAVYDGVARAARDWLVDFARSQAPPALGAPLVSLPRFLDGIGRIEVLLSVNARLLRSLGRDHDEERPIGADASHVRHVVIDNAVAITELALELGGNPGVSRNAPLERHHRDALTGRAHAPQNALIRANAAKAFLAAHASPGA